MLDLDKLVLEQIPVAIEDGSGRLRVCKEALTIVLRPDEPGKEPVRELRRAGIAIATHADITLYIQADEEDEDAWNITAVSVGKQVMKGVNLKRWVDELQDTFSYEIRDHVRKYVPRSSWEAA